MPGDQPGTLKRTDIADVMALILRVNGLPAGPRALPSGKTALTLIGMESAQ